MTLSIIRIQQIYKKNSVPLTYLNDNFISDTKNQFEFTFL